MKKILVLLLFTLSISLQGQRAFTGVLSSSVGVSSPVNLISNGTFDNATDWAGDLSEVEWNITGGVATYADQYNAYLTQADGDMVSSILPNTAYTLTFDVASAGTIYLIIQNAAHNVTYLDYAQYGAGIGQHVHFTTPADVSGAGFSFRGATNSTAAGSIDNLVLTKD